MGWGIAHHLRALTALSEVSSEPSVPPVPKGLTPSSGLYGHAYGTYANAHTHKVKSESL